MGVSVNWLNHQSPKLVLQVQVLAPPPAFFGDSMNIAIQFVKEAYYELKKASWLSRQEATGSTRAVILIVCLIAIYVASIDFILSIVLGSILGR